MNYGNRPIRKQQDPRKADELVSAPWDPQTKIDKRAVKSYLGAVGSAMAVSLSVRWVSLRIRNRALLLLAPVCGVVSAAVANLYLTRAHELTEGIEVADADGNCIGRSQVAAQKALLETAISRAVLPLPSLGLTPFMFQYLDSAPWYQSVRRMGWSGPLIVRYIALLLMSAITVPPSFALFPHRGQLPRSELEPSLQAKLSRNHSHVSYNKGL
eukprot:CAMPEP_0184500268 /NCGR_PEP_ID=MMETSP0113_2-20130426/44157_1 /TAXON_ID=91329 /ORGANISM="Norrisiella sphaerica, Strain BC52" /LENGTH=212 /DNA_ID=CAMNT_0026888559 /DNA_START=173 /DNA_END=811 /DNA_ORIENTATION=-